MNATSNEARKYTTGRFELRGQYGARVASFSYFSSDERLQQRKAAVDRKKAMKADGHKVTFHEVTL